MRVQIPEIGSKWLSPKEQQIEERLKENRDLWDFYYWLDRRAKRQRAGGEGHKLYMRVMDEISQHNAPRTYPWGKASTEEVAKLKEAFENEIVDIRHVLETISGAIRDIRQGVPGHAQKTLEDLAKELRGADFRQQTKEEERGFRAAMKAVEKDGNTIEAAKKHMGVSSGDLSPDEFTKGWRYYCDKFIELNRGKGIKEVDEPQEDEGIKI